MQLYIITSVVGYSICDNLGANHKFFDIIIYFSVQEK